MKHYDAAIIMGLLLLLGLPQCSKTDNRIDEDKPEPSQAYCEFYEQVEQATASARFQSEIFYYLIPDLPTPTVKRNEIHVVNPTLGVVDTILIQ